MKNDEPQNGQMACAPVERFVRHKATKLKTFKDAVKKFSAQIKEDEATYFYAKERLLQIKLERLL